MLGVDASRNYRPDVVEFCEGFVRGNGRPRYVMGRNDYARSIGALVEIDGYIDDFTSDAVFAGKPIV